MFGQYNLAVHPLHIACQVTAVVGVRREGARHESALFETGRPKRAVRLHNVRILFANGGPGGTHPEEVLDVFNGIGGTVVANGRRDIFVMAKVAVSCVYHTRDDSTYNARVVYGAGRRLPIAVGGGTIDAALDAAHIGASDTGRMPL